MNNAYTFLPITYLITVRIKGEPFWSLLIKQKQLIKTRREYGIDSSALHLFKYVLSDNLEL